ncbi:MAG TPA: 6-bladed beta-propeller [Longimicrobiales bacterium]
MRMWRSRGVLLCVALAACGGGPAGEWGGTVSDSSGVSIVANPETGLWRGAEAWTVEETLRIGALDGAAAYQFGAIQSLDVDSRGRIYVLDQQAQQIRVFDADGRHVRTIGRPGSGPGELSRGAMAVVVGAGDTLYVPDAMQQRVNRFLPDGTFLGSFPLPITEGIPARWARLPDGRLAQEVRPAPVPGEAGRDAVHAILVRGAGGAVVDTLLRLPRGETLQFQGGTPRILLFAPEPAWAVASDGSILSGVNTDYRIEVRTPDGRLTRIVTRPFERIPVAESDRQEILRALDELWSRAGMPAPQRRQMLPAVRFADHYPAYNTVAAGPGGTIWVQHVQSAARAAESGSFSSGDVGAPEWDVFDADGRFLGVVAFPERFRALRFLGTDVYGVWRDELDVQHVMRLRIVGPGTVG